MKGINERLHIVVNGLFDGNKAKFAKAIGIAPTSISNYLSGKRQSTPSAEMLEKILNVVENLSAEWLLAGKGPMLKDSPSKEVRQSSHGDNSTNVYGDGNQVNVPPGDTERLQERIRHLEEMVAEKEKMISEKERIIRLYETVMGKK